MTMRRVPSAGPVWQPPRIDMGRRMTVLGLAGVALLAIGGGRAAAQASRSCVLTPEAGEGPFYVDPELIRSDITEGRPGAPLQLALQVVRAGDCATLANARVDVWHADAIGLYSGYERQRGVGVSSESAVGRQYLRGTQFTDGEGRTAFRTIYPSWYGGRTPHVHFKVFLGDNEVVASQIFFPDEINDDVFTQWDPYREHVSQRTAFNHNDPIPQGVYSDVTRAGRAYAATAALVVDPTRRG